MRTYYDLLNLAKDADKNDIKRAFHRLAKELHPDTARHRPAPPLGTSGGPGAPGNFIEVLDAYETLIDEGKRAAYNSLIGQERPRVLPKSRVSFAFTLSDVARYPRRSRAGAGGARGAWNPKGYHASVRLTREELSGGAAVTVDMPAHVVCPSCGGDSVHCGLCSCRGYVLRAVPVTVPIPKHLAHGEVFAFPLRRVKMRGYAFFTVERLYLKILVSAL